MSYEEKYLKYKTKYLNIKNLQLGGSSSDMKIGGSSASASASSVSNIDVLELLFYYQNLFNRLQYNINFSNIEDIEEIKKSIYGNDPLDNKKITNVIIFISNLIKLKIIEDHKEIIVDHININLGDFINSRRLILFYSLRFYLFENQYCSLSKPTDSYLPT